MATVNWPKNAWVGTTVDTQARVAPAEEAFSKINASVKFLSCEPLLEDLEWNDLEVFDWVIIGAQTKSTRCPEVQPDREWVATLYCNAMDAGCSVYLKPNLRAGVKEYPTN